MTTRKPYWYMKRGRKAYAGNIVDAVRLARDAAARDAIRLRLWHTNRTGCLVLRRTGVAVLIHGTKTAEDLAAWETDIETAELWPIKDLRP